jgi:methionyl-tRNA formyltransferase
MRFAITAVDRCLSVFDGLLAEGWDPVKLFTIPPSALTNLNKATIAKAVSLEIPVQLSRMDETDLRDLRDRGCEVLICASYDWRIGDWRPYLPYAVNFHPSPLPLARGPYPAFQALLEGRRDWGVSCHKLEPKFDVGDILDAEPFSLSDNDCHESLSLKTEMAFGRLARRLARGLPDLWSQASPQGPGSYWKRLTDADRTLDFATPVETILRKVRAFGLTESIARMNDKVVYVRRAVGWTEAHRHTPGAVVHVNGRRSVVAALDGYIGLIEWSPIPLAATEVVGRTIAPMWE